MINWSYYPKSKKAPRPTLDVVNVFNAVFTEIDSEKHSHNSNEVLEIVSSGLRQLDYQVESGKKSDQKINVPVLFGTNGKLEKYFDADAYHERLGYVVEVEAGRAVANNQFLKDLFQACMMHGVNHLIIAVRNRYKNSNDFERVLKFFDTLYASNRINLPLEGILIIGY